MSREPFGLAELDSFERWLLLKAGTVCVYSLCDVSFAGLSSYLKSMNSALHKYFNRKLDWFT